MSWLELQGESASFETEFAEGNAYELPNIQNLSMEQKLISEFKAVESLVEKQLQKLRQKKEKRELPSQPMFADESYAFEGENLNNTSLSSNQPVTPDPSGMLEVSEMNAMCEDLVGGNVPDVPLSPEFSPLVVGISWSDDCDRTPSPTEQDLAHQLYDFPLYDEEPSSTLSCSMSNIDDVLSSQSSVSNLLRQPEVNLSQNQFRMSKSPSYGDQRRNIRLNTNFKTVICNKWKLLGYCPYGEKCTFAHGLRELRMRPVEHKKLNNTICKNFSAGCCLRGSLCRFSHVFDHRISNRLNDR